MDAKLATPYSADIQNHQKSNKERKNIQKEGSASPRRSHSRAPHVVFFKAGQRIFSRGDPADTLYKLVSGRVMIVNATDKRRLVVDVIHSARLFGFCSGARFDYDAVVLHEAAVECWNKQLFEADKRNVDELLAAISNHAAHLRQLAFSLACETALERLINFLLSICADADPWATSVELPLSRTDLADHLGMTLETISRCFSKLRQKGIIEILPQNRIRIRDFGALQNNFEL